MENPESLNRYAYTGNDPIDFVDHMGLLRCMETEDAHICWQLLGFGSGGIHYMPLLPLWDEGGGGPANNGKPTPEQCKEIQNVLAVEQAYGTMAAALAGNINIPGGPQLLHDFNSQNSDYQPINTARGPVNLDWFTTLNMTPYEGVAFFRYGLEKTAWNLIRGGAQLLGIPGVPNITNYIPYSAADERNAAYLASIPGFGYKDLFTPQWMQQNCK